MAEAEGAVPRLRRFVLDLAVRGKLVAQDPADEPASELLKRIAAEKARLVKAGEIRKMKAVPSLERDDLPFPLPHGWAWTQIAELGVISPRNEAPDDREASFVPMPMIAAEYGVANGRDPRQWGDIKKGYTHFAEGDVGLAKISPCFENGKSTVFRNLITREAPMGEVCIIPEGEQICLGQRMMLVRLVPGSIDPRFMLYSLRDPDLMERVQDKPLGMTVQHLRVGGVETLLIPLPPLAEQQRIVAKVDALMALCDRLETALTTADTTRARLLDTLLHEALTPSGRCRSEVAQQAPSASAASAASALEAADSPAITL